MQVKNTQNTGPVEDISGFEQVAEGDGAARYGVIGGRVHRENIFHSDQLSPITIAIRTITGETIGAHGADSRGARIRAISL